MGITRRTRRPGLAGIAAAIIGTALSGPAMAACALIDPLYFTADTPLTLNGTFVSAQSYALRGTPPVAFAIPGLPAHVKLRGFGRDSQGDVYFIANTGVTLDGVFYPRGHVVRWDGSAFSAVVQPLMEGVAPLRAFEIRGASRYAVTEGDYWVSPTEYIGPRDVLVSLDDGESWAFHRVGEPGDLPKRVKISAFAVIDDDTWLLAFSTTFRIGDSTYRPSDLVRYQRSTRTFTLAHALTGDSDRWYSARLAGLTITAASDRIFCNGFD